MGVSVPASLKVVVLVADGELATGAGETVLDGPGKAVDVGVGVTVGMEVGSCVAAGEVGATGTREGTGEAVGLEGSTGSVAAGLGAAEAVTLGTG